MYSKIEFLLIPIQYHTFFANKIERTKDRIDAAQDLTSSSSSWWERAKAIWWLFRRGTWATYHNSPQSSPDFYEKTTFFREWLLANPSSSSLGCLLVANWPTSWWSGGLSGGTVVCLIKSRVLRASSWFLSSLLLLPPASRRPAASSSLSRATVPAIKEASKARKRVLSS